MRYNYSARTSEMVLRGACLFAALSIGLGAHGAGAFSGDQGVEILTRGPIHEAFAVASAEGSTVALTVSRAPYEAIDEVPPNLRPDGADVSWISGYWGWDEDRDDYIWVSGVWRDIPPGRQWVPGYWTPAQGGYQWISGFWGYNGQTEIDYLPTPPQSLEMGPSSPTPVPGNVWSPGCWVWQQSRYDWQPGYWVAQQPDWVWTPAHYTWTPRGYVYVPGFWDYDLVHRGVIFAPVYYAQPVYRRHDYYYSPTIIIDLRAITASLFVRPQSRQYFFGDYYDARYETRGFYPWYATGERGHGYDPLYGHYRSEQLRHDRDWDIHVVEQYHHRRDHVDARPPQTLAIQININTQRGGTPDNHFLGRSLAESADNNTQPVRFRKVDRAEREQFETRGREVRTFQTERAKIETRTKDDGKPGSPRETRRTVRVDMPVSPRSATRSTDARTPPAAPDASIPRVTDGRGRASTPQNTDGKPAARDNVQTPRTNGPAIRNPTADRKVAPNVPVRTPQRTEAVGNTTPRNATPRSAAPSGPRVQAPAPATRNAPAPKASDGNKRMQKAQPRVDAPPSTTTIRHGRRTSSVGTDGDKDNKNSREKSRGQSVRSGTPRR